MTPSVATDQSRTLTLALGEKLLLGAMRQWAALRASGEVPSRPVAQSLAFRSSQRVGGLFIAWMQSVEATLRRPIEVECSVCGGVSQDEQRLLASCGLAGAATAIGAQILDPLVIDAQPVMVLARALNAALSVEGYPLPVRLSEASMARRSMHRSLH